MKANSRNDRRGHNHEAAAGIDKNLFKQVSMQQTSGPIDIIKTYSKTAWI
jgi:hypothetical protein